MRRVILTAMVLASCNSNQAPPPFAGCDQGAATHVQELLDQNESGCAVDDDCTVVEVALSCFNEGDQPVLKSQADSVAGQLEQIDKQFCAGSTCASTTGGGFGGTVICSSGTCEFGEPDAGLQDPPGFGGYFHEVGIPQALNLRLNPTGLYSAALYGCNVQEAFGGEWYQEEDGGPALLTHGSTQAVLTLGDGGVLTTDSPLFFDDGGIDTLAPGAVCAICDGGGGPQGLVPCDHPFGF